MAAPGERHRGAESRRAAARHRHVAGQGGGRGRSERALAPGLRVLPAADGKLSRDPKEAGVAGDAGPHLAERPSRTLVGDLGVRDELPRHPDQVRIALAKDPLRVLRFLDPAEGDHRHRVARLSAAFRSLKTSCGTAAGGISIQKLLNVPASEQKRSTCPVAASARAIQGHSRGRSRTR